MNDIGTDHSEPGSPREVGTSTNQVPSLLTVSQAYDYLISENLTRSKKTIRKWCRLNHVEKKENTIPGGPKWLITKSSLDAKIAEERLIDAALKKETSSNLSGRVLSETSSNQSEPVHIAEIVKVLKEQLNHERDMRKDAEVRNKNLLEMYHDISIQATKVGIEIGRGMQEQARVRQIEAGFEPSSNHTDDKIESPTRDIDYEQHNENVQSHREGDNSGSTKPEPGVEST